MKDNHVEDILAKRDKEFLSRIKGPEMPTKIRVLPIRVNKNLIALDYIPIVKEYIPGVIIPESIQKDKIFKAVVIAIGAEVTDYNVGEIVAFDPQSANCVLVEDREVYLVYPSNILFAYTNIKLGY